MEESGGTQAVMNGIARARIIVEHLENLQLNQIGTLMLPSPENHVLSSNRP